MLLNNQKLQLLIFVISVLALSILISIKQSSNQNISLHTNQDYRIIFDNDSILIKEMNLGKDDKDNSLPWFELDKVYKYHILESEQRNLCSVSPTSIDPAGRICTIRINDIEWQLKSKIEPLADPNYNLLKNNTIIWSENLNFYVDTPVRYIISSVDHLLIGYYKVSSDYKDFKYNILLDGKSVVNKYRLDDAIKPMDFKDKPSFFGESDGKWLLYISDESINLDYDSIVDPSCCDAFSFRIVNNSKNILFFAKRDDVWYHVIVEAKMNSSLP